MGFHLVLWVQQHREYRVWPKKTRANKKNKLENQNQGKNKKKTKKNQNLHFPQFFFFLFCFFLVSSGDSSCRFVFLVIMFLFFVFFKLLAKIHFLCSTRGHKSSGTVHVLQYIHIYIIYVFHLYRLRTTAYKHAQTTVTTDNIIRTVLYIYCYLVISFFASTFVLF